MISKLSIFTTIVTTAVLGQDVLIHPQVQEVDFQAYVTAAAKRMEDARSFRLFRVSTFGLRDREPSSGSSYPSVNNDFLGFVWGYDKELKKIDPSVVVPAWNFTQYAGNYAKDPVLGECFYGYPGKCPKKPSPAKDWCEKLPKFNQASSPTFHSEKEIYAIKDIREAASKIEDNTYAIARHIWGRGFHPGNDYAPLFASIQAHHMNVFVQWGLANKQTIDVDEDKMLCLSPSFFNSSLPKTNPDCINGYYDPKTDEEKGFLF